MSGNSYQKNGGVGVYNEVPNGGSQAPKGKNKTLIGAVVIVAVAIAGYFYVDMNKHSGAAVAKVMEKADLNVKANGKLKLFDKTSTYNIGINCWLVGWFVVVFCLVHSFKRTIIGSGLVLYCCMDDFMEFSLFDMNIFFHCISNLFCR